MEIIRANLWEIKKSGSLKTLGGLLALFHLLQFYVWLGNGHAPLKYVQQGLPMCWSLFENCDWIRSIPFGMLDVIYFSYAVTAGLAAAVLLLTEWFALGYYLLLASMMFGMSLYFQDLRLSNNEGFMIFFMTFAYLFFPSKHRLMRWLVVSFFVARGLSQASPDWLSGNWYMEHLSLPVKLAEWLAAMSVLVHMVGGAVLLFRDGRYFWSGWGSLLTYECAQLYMGDFAGSCISLGALAYVALDELELRKAEREYIYQSFIRPEPSMIWGAGLLIFFWSAQLTPFLSLERDNSVVKVLDVWALHPEAAHEECEQKTYAVFKGRVQEINVQPEITRSASMACNEYLRFLDLKSLCRQMQEKDPAFITLSSSLQVRSFRQKTTHRAFEVKDFCNANLTFKNLGDVRWTTNPGI